MWTDCIKNTIKTHWYRFVLGTKDTYQFSLKMVNPVQVTQMIKVLVWVFVWIHFSVERWTKHCVDHVTFIMVTDEHFMLPACFYSHLWTVSDIKTLVSSCFLSFFLSLQIKTSKRTFLHPEKTKICNYLGVNYQRFGLQRPEDEMLTVSNTSDSNGCFTGTS